MKFKEVHAYYAQMRDCQSQDSCDCIFEHGSLEEDMLTSFVEALDRNFYLESKLSRIKHTLEYLTEGE